MSFASEFDSLSLVELSAFGQHAMAADVEAALARSEASGKRLSLADFAALISPVASQPTYLEAMARRSHDLTVKHFGRVMRFFAPLYLSNECINICKYCGFSRDNPILRVTLTLDQVATEARYLREQGSNRILCRTIICAIAWRGCIPNGRVFPWRSGHWRPSSIRRLCRLAAKDS